jgi:hypothetical protein
MLSFMPDDKPQNAASTSPARKARKFEGEEFKAKLEMTTNSSSSSRHRSFRKQEMRLSRWNGRVALNDCRLNGESSFLPGLWLRLLVRRILDKSVLANRASDLEPSHSTHQTHPREQWEIQALHGGFFMSDYPAARRKLITCKISNFAALLRIRQLGWSDELVCEQYAVSSKMVNYRMHTSGVNIQYARSRA